VSANADSYQVFIRGQNVSDGGTSASTPLWAALIALVNQGIGGRMWRRGPRRRSCWPLTWGRGTDDPRATAPDLLRRALAALPERVRAGGRVALRADAGYFAGALARAAHDEHISFAIGASGRPGWRVGSSYGCAANSVRNPSAVSRSSPVSGPRVLARWPRSLLDGAWRYRSRSRSLLRRPSSWAGMTAAAR
jgi:hypothetical protein